MYIKKNASLNNRPLSSSIAGDVVSDKDDVDGDDTDKDDNDPFMGTVRQTSGKRRRHMVRRWRWTGYGGGGGSTGSANCYNYSYSLPTTEKEGMGLLEYQTMRVVAHDGWLCIITI